MAAAEAGTPLWATVKTTMGDISLVLYSKDAPRTVANFVGLATGEKSWRDPRSGQQAPAGKPLYTDTIFHRVIPEFMIQGGDPEGSGRGDPGYRFADEFQSGRKFDHPGILAMANAGPGTNGSQFFITVKPVPWLNDHHTVFGDVVSGFDVVQAIANTPRDADDRPRTEVRILGISITFQNPKR
jgi:peptidyl-prolyl cis-trans isomerase A (cyclophilin A)